MRAVHPGAPVGEIGCLYTCLSGLVVAAILQGCGGAGADTLPLNPGINPVAMEQNSFGLKINRQATATDAYGGGLSVTRDTTGLIGGTRGHVNATSYTHTVVGRGITAFEWAKLAVLDNWAEAGENVAVYAQGNKHSTGPTWAAVSEVFDNSGLPGAVVAHEFDVWVSGRDAGNRYGLDIVLGDSKTMRGGGVASDIVEGSAAIRIGSSPASSEYTKWVGGQLVGGPTPHLIWNRGLQFTGNYIAAIDLSTANASAPIRLAKGQAISLDAYDQVRILLGADGRIHFMNGTKSMHSFAMTP